MFNLHILALSVVNKGYNRYASYVRNL